MRRKAKSRKAALEWFKIKVTASAASVSYRGPGLSRIDPDGDADSVIKIIALSRLKGSLTADVEAGLGGVLASNGGWSVRSEFSYKSAGIAQPNCILQNRCLN